MKSDHGSEWYETHEMRLERRPIVQSLDEGVLRDLIARSQALIRSKNALELEAFFAPDAVVNAFRFIAGRFEPYRMNRDQYFLSTSDWFSLHDTSEYSMSIESIVLDGSTRAQLRLAIHDPDNKIVSERIGPKYEQIVNVGIYKHRAVIQSVDVILSSSNKAMQPTRAADG